MGIVINWDVVFENLSWTLSEELKRRSPVFDGELRQSIQPKWTPEKLTIYAVHYARYVNDGTMPHFPPIEALKKWARVKFGDENAAYAIQKKIGKYGTKPQPFIDETLEQELVSMFSEALKAPGAISVK